MPCYRCGVRQTDPVRGPSPWKRGVRGGGHVLICPDCQRTHDWTGDLDHCAACGSTMLVRILGETHCRACGATGERAAPDGAISPRGAGAAGSIGSAEAVGAGNSAGSGGGPEGPRPAAGLAAAAGVASGPTPGCTGDADLAGAVEAALDRLFGRAKA